ncbi:MAG: hypothetical protein E7365_05095 [Clostridiales bacterium]|nr:hypothetical protein [Clostridiales bacterium]
MFEIISFIIGIIILLISGFMAFNNRHRIKGCISLIMTGTLFASFVMILPVFFNGVKCISDGLYAVLQSLIYALKTLGGGQDYEFLADIQLSGFLKSAYLIINYLCYIICPIVTSGLIISFIGDAFDRIRYTLSIKEKCYVFSALNEKSLSLAKTIDKDGKIIFLNAKDCDEGLKTGARKEGALLLHGSVFGLKLFKNKKYHIYLIEKDEDNNVDLAQGLITKIQEKKDVKTIIYAFCNSGANVDFLESLINKNSNVEVRCIDETALLCSHLVFEHPLYILPSGFKEISVALIGLGNYGIRMLKTVYWAGQIEGLNLKIRAYDKNADKIKGQFLAECPLLKNDDTIEFINADVLSQTFDVAFFNKNNSSDATHVFVCMGDDGLNFTITEKFYRIFRQKRDFDKEKLPQFFTRVRSSKKTHSLFENSAFLENRNIHLFGTLESIYSKNTIFNSHLENLAFAVHLAYWGALTEDKNSEIFKMANHDFKTKEYDRRNSMAAAIHLNAKLFASGVLKDAFPNIEEIEEYKRLIQDEKLLLKLSKNEHLRWNAFMATEGYNSTTIDDIKKYANETKNHKDLISKGHPCIIPWDDLDDLENEYNLIAKEKGYKLAEFKKYDIMIVREIPAIFEVATQLDKEK